MEIFKKRECLVLLFITFLFLIAAFKLNYNYKEQIGGLEYICLRTIRWELEKIIDASETNQITEELLAESITSINTTNIIIFYSPNLSFFNDWLYRNIIDPANEVDLDIYLADNLGYIKKLEQSLNELINEMAESGNTAINTYNYFNNERNRINFENNYLKKE